MNVIQVEGLVKQYNNFQLGPVSFSVPEGSIVGFIGENGAGKTTTIKAIMGMLKPDEGQIKIFGKEQQDKDAAWKEQVGVVLDTCRFPENMTPEDVGKVMAQIYSTWDGNKYTYYLKKFRIDCNKYVKELSRGMGMKLSLAVALSHDSKLLILDEATSGLDPVVRKETLDIFLDFVQEENHTIFLSSHITSDIEQIADYILLIHQGKILLYENKDSLLYEYGVLKCPKGKRDILEQWEVIAVRENTYGLEALVKRGKAGLPEEAVIDQVKLDDLLLFFKERE